MDSVLRQQLIAFLTTAQAHMTFLDAVKDFPKERINEFPPHVDYSPWMLLEHIRLTQKDILDFMIDSKYKEPHWPDDYWPKKKVKADEKMWNKTVKGYTEDLEKLAVFVNDPKTNLDEKITNGDGQIILREMLLIIDHTSYHIGEFSILRQVMGTWPAGHK